MSDLSDKDPWPLPWWAKLICWIEDVLMMCDGYFGVLLIFLVMVGWLACMCFFSN